MWDFGGGRPLSGAGPPGETTPIHPRDPTAGTGPCRHERSPREFQTIKMTGARLGGAPPSRFLSSSGQHLKGDGLASTAMDRPSAFAHHRFVGDKRTQQVYDLDQMADEEALAIVLDELMASERFLCFGPDTLAEARNRGYRLRSF